MKRLLLVLFVFMTSFSSLNAQQKLYPKIDKVSVFRQSAQVEKSIEISLEKGFNEILLCGNSHRLSVQSIQFNSSTDYIITDFSPYTQFVKTSQEKEDRLSDKDKVMVKKIKDSIELFRDIRQEVRDRIDILMREETVLSKMRELDSPTKVDSISTVKDAMDLYKKRSIEIGDLLYDLNAKDILYHSKIRKQKDDLKIILQDEDENNNTSKQEYYISLSIYSKVKVEKTSIIYKYNVVGIEWTPVYDIKFSTKNDMVSFLLKSELQQRTGEDWMDIDMVFSAEEQNSNLQPIGLEPMVYRKKLKGTDYDTRVTAETGKRITNDDIDRMSANTVDAIIATVGGISDSDGGVYESGSGTTRGESGMITYVNGVAKKSSVNLPKIAIAETQVELGGTRASDRGNERIGTGVFAEDIDKVPGSPIRNSSYTTYSSSSSSKEDKPEYDIITENAAKGLASSSSSLSEDYKVMMKYSIKSGDKSKIIPLYETKAKVNYKYFSVPKKERLVYLAALFPLWEDLGIVSARANLYIDDKFVSSTYIVPNEISDTLKLFVGREKNVVIDRRITKDKPTPTNRKGTEFEQVINVKIMVKNNNNKAIDIKIDDQIPISSSEKITITKGELQGATYDEKTGVLYWDISMKALESKTINFSFTSRYPKNVILPID